MTECIICGKYSIQQCCKEIGREEKYKIILEKFNQNIQNNNEVELREILTVFAHKIEIMKLRETININPMLKFNDNIIIQFYNL